MGTALLGESGAETLKVPPDPLGGEPREHYEVVDGRIVEEPPLGAHEIWIASYIARLFARWERADEVGQMIVEMIFELRDDPRLRRRPDVAFVSSRLWPVDEPAPDGAVWDVVPELAVEIVSPTDLVDDLMSKVEEYFAVGVREVWVIHPKYRKLYVYQSPKSVLVLDQHDTLNGGDIIPGFVMPLSKIFKIPANPPTR